MTEEAALTWAEVHARPWADWGERPGFNLVRGDD